MKSTDGIFLALPEATGDGITLAVKDLFDTAGPTTTYGSPIFAEHVPTETAVAVRRLEAAGYTNIGKTNLHEFAYGVTSMNPHFGWVPNPGAPGRIAAAPAEARPPALGWRTCRRGARQRHRRLDPDSRGVLRCRRLQAVVRASAARRLLAARAQLRPRGPMARTVADCVAMMNALAGVSTEPVELDELRIAVAWTDEAQPGIRTRVEEAAALFPHAEPISFPHAQGHLPVFMREVAEVHEALFVDHADEYGDDVAWKLRELCFKVTDAEVAEAERVRESFREQAAELLEGFDLLLTPTQAFVAPTYEQAADDSYRIPITRFTNPFNALGWPALALPCGPAEHGLPASVQLVGRPGADALVLAAGSALEAQVPA